MENPPLVSVICLCYNQARFVSEAIRSVYQQSYPAIELIIVDDASRDESPQIIEKLALEAPIQVKTILLDTNVGNCTAFNRGLSEAKGDYIIDLAADDILLPKCIETAITIFETAPENIGVLYANAISIDESGNEIKAPAPKKPRMYEGDIYESLITHYWINPATMVIKKSVMNDLGGYDETLSFEDFDFWIRSSRDWQYAYSDVFFAKKRKVKRSLSTQQSNYLNHHLLTIFHVCEKIRLLNQNQQENQALKKRIRYEMKNCLKTGHLALLIRFWRLYQKI